ncbi:MAG: lipopolysaccharide biosynthesis protein RfbH [Zetaproteobacteria bacterium]|nr:lipopolysaccharide biosynthesis protein RfbH [Zetaproteobacteria bacterium]
MERSIDPVIPSQNLSEKVKASGLLDLEKQHSLSSQELARKVKSQILSLTELYYEIEHKPRLEKEKTQISYAGRWFDQQEMCNLVDSSLEFWLTSGRYCAEFEKKLGDQVGAKYVSLVNSGSSANLIAMSALTSPKLGERAVLPGDEVITVAAGFPATITPIIQSEAVPVFVDIQLPTYNIDTRMLEAGLSSRTKAVMLAHTLGNPFDAETVRNFCNTHNLWLVEDNCDALGAQFTFADGSCQPTGTLGDIGTSSFYPPHHITTGEGGAAYTNRKKLNMILNSFRDWGRDCWCESGCDNTCGRRFTQQQGTLPKGYDHKYTYAHFGYNLKMTDLQASIGSAQVDKLPHFVQRRNENWQRLYDGMKYLEEYFILPEATPSSHPSWFGFLFCIRPGVPLSRVDMAKYLEQEGIQTRMLFAGNFLRHPCFDRIRHQTDRYRVVGELTQTDFVMEHGLWVGVYPGILERDIDKVITTIKEYVTKKLQ